MLRCCDGCFVVSPFDRVTNDEHLSPCLSIGMVAFHVSLRGYVQQMRTRYVVAGSFVYEYRGSACVFC